MHCTHNDRSNLFALPNIRPITDDELEDMMFFLCVKIKCEKCGKSFGEHFRKRCPHQEGEFSIKVKEDV